MRFHQRATEKVALEIPKDALDSIRKVAGIRDMSVQALLKFYIGQGLRQDLSKLFTDRVLDKTAEILARYIQSPEEVSTIMREIQEARVQASNDYEVAV